MPLSDRKPLSHEFTPACVTELLLCGLRHFTKSSPPSTHPHTTRLPSLAPLPFLSLTILLLQAYCMKPIHLFSVETWQRALICDGTSVLQAPTKSTVTGLSRKESGGWAEWWVVDGGGWTARADAMKCA